MYLHSVKPLLYSRYHCYWLSTPFPPNFHTDSDEVHKETMHANTGLHAEEMATVDFMGSEGGREVT